VVAISTPAGPSLKSTIVRMSAMRASIGLLGRVSTPLAAAIVERLFSTPPRPRRSRGWRDLARAQRFEVRVDGRSIAAWRWGESGPSVVLVHGWGGQAAQLSSFAPSLVDRGLSVVAFDGPGHGRSGRGMSSAPELSRALLAVAGRVPAVHGVVAHSLGAAATAIAMRNGLGARRVAFLAPMMDPVGWLGDMSALLGVSEAVAARARARCERRIGVDWDQLRFARLSRDPGVPALVVHDTEDSEVPLSQTAAIAASWTSARFVETAGLGHNRILRNPAVVEEVVAFVAEEVERCGCGATKVPGRSRCGACTLDLELFDRDLRLSRSRPANG
jgi:pimeloyl-ACP methyl ester carboxylesterase